MTDQDYHGKLGARVGHVSRAFWRDNSSTLQRHGLGWRDVQQQSWVEVLVLAKEWQTNPTKYLHGRLIDWMRHATRWTKSTRTPAPFVESFEYPENMNNPIMGCNADSWHPPQSPLDFEKRQIISRLYEAARQHGARTERMLHAYMDGDSMATIGRQHMVTEGRVSQVLKKVVGAVKQTVMVGGIFLSLAPFAWGQLEGPEMIDGCTSVAWQANAETDLAGYQIFVSKDGTALPPVDVAKTETAFPCSSLPVVEGSTYSIQMTAYDTSGNVSAPSSAVGFIWPDTTAPNVPTGLCLDVVINGEPRQLCLTIN